MALGEADPGQTPGGGADALLSQIRDLLEQYIQLGPDTPVAQQAQDLASAIDQTQGGGDGTQSPMDGDQDPTADAGASDPGAMLGALQSADQGAPARGSAKTFGDANKTALPALEEMNKKKNR